MYLRITMDRAAFRRFLIIIVDRRILLMASAFFSRFERSLKVMVYGALGKRGERNMRGKDQ
jgi:hypothetical protein